MLWTFKLPLSSRAKLWQKLWQIFWSHLKIRTAPIIMSWNFLKSSFVEVFWKFELHLLSWAEIFAKIKRFVEVIWKFELPLLSRAESFSKKQKFCWSFLKTWTAPTTSWNFHKNKAVLLTWFENLTCPYITSWHFRKNKAHLMSLENWTGPIIAGVKFWQK